MDNQGDTVIMSESPEEQLSTGVLGRIGSWLSPWRGNAPKSSSENASSPSDWTENTGGDEEDFVRTHAREQRWQDGSASPLFKSVLPCEEEDATQSAHRDGSVLSGTETGAEGPREEEREPWRKQRTGQGEEREGTSNGASASGSPQKNVSHLRHLSSSSKQGVAWDFDQAHTQTHAHRQAQTGKRLHVYLEETSVSLSGQDKCAGTEVVRTTVKKNLKVFAHAKSSPGFDLPNSTSLTSTEKNVRPAAGAQSYYSTLVGVSLKPHKGSQSEPEPAREQSEADDMGRKNANRRKIRKNSQGDGGKSPVEKKPGNTPAAEVFSPSDNSVTSPQDKSPNAHLKEASADSSFKPKLTLLVLPEGGESEIPSSDMVKQLGDFQNSISVAGVSQVRESDSAAAMEEDDDSFYRVERKTETPESKRRSMKVSRSEVKLFTKHVPFSPKLNQTAEHQDLDTKKKTATPKDKTKTETNVRLPDAKKTVEEPKAAVGRIADKISLFEQKQQDVGLKKTIQALGNADVSPVRTVTDKNKVFLSTEQRTRLDERYDNPRFGPASPNGEKLMTIKERTKIFTEAGKSEEKPTLTQQITPIAGMSQKSSLSVAVSGSKSSELGNQDKLDAKEPIHIKKPSKIRSKQDEQGSSAVGGQISTSETQLMDVETKETKTEEQVTKPNISKRNDPAGSPDMTNTTPTQPKSPNRTGSRSKRRKNKEPASPISQNDQNKDNTIKQVEVDNSDKMPSASKPLPETMSLASQNLRADTSAAQPSNDTKQETLKNDLEGLDKQTMLHASVKTKNIEKMKIEQEGSTQPAVIRDEPDTATCSSGTKKTISKDADIVLQQEEKLEEHSFAFTPKTKTASEDSSEISAPSPLIAPSSEQHHEKPPAAKQELSAGQPKLDKDSSVQPKSKSKQKGKEETLQPQSLNTELISQAENDGVSKLKTVGSEETNQITEKTQQLPLPDKSPTKGDASHSGQSISGKERRAEEAKQLKTPCQPSERTSGSPALSVQTQNATVTPENPICTTTQTNEGTESDKEPQKVGTATDVPPESQTQSTESSGTKRESAVIAAEPPPGPVSVEKTKSLLDDSCAHGANDAGFSNSKPITKAGAQDEGVSAEGTNDTTVLVPAQIAVTHSVKTDSSTKKPHISDCKSTRSEVEEGGFQKGSTVKSMLSEEISFREMQKPAFSHTSSEGSENTESSINISSTKDAEKITQSRSDSITSSSTGNETDKRAEKRLTQPVDELSPAANSDISLHSHLHTVKKEPTNDTTSPTQKAPFLLEANKLIPDSMHRSSMKKLALPKELMQTDFLNQQDAPSSWLDVDFPKRKLKVSEAKLTSSGSESNLLDTSGELDDDDFVERIKNLCAPFSLPPRKHNQFRPPQPPFAMPAIREDRYEKPFDPKEFTFGLRKKNLFSLDTPPSLLAKLQSTETKSGLLPARVSVSDRSMLLSGIDSPSHLKDKSHVTDGEEVKEEKTDQIKVKSRLERSSILSSLASSSYRGKRNEAQTQSEGSENVLPSKATQLSPALSPQPAPPSPTATDTIKDELAKQSKEEARAAETAVSDSGPPLPSFNDIRLPDYLEKYLPQDQAKAEQSVEGEDQVKPEPTAKMASSVSETKADEVLKASPVLPGAAAPCFPGIPPTTHTTLPELKPPMTQPHSTFKDHIRTVKGFHKRPGKMVLFEKAQFSGQTYEIYSDVADASSLELSPFISVKVVRGCWLLYEKPGFQGRLIALEEGGTELENMWADPAPEAEPHNVPPMIIGSIRLAVRDYSIPHIDLFAEPDGCGRVTPFHDDAIETGSFGILLNTASIQVHSGVWLVFSDPGFQGVITVLEKGVYPVPEAWGFESPFVGSLRPLKMGGFKVENPNEVQAVVYEKPGFEGSFLEIDSDVLSFSDADGGIATNGANLDTNKLKSVGSLKIVGGFWVGYSQPGFEGQQHILEEGEYLDCSDWGGSELLSLRPILSDFLSPHLKMFSDKNFGKLGVNIDLTVPVVNMDTIGYGMKTQSIDVFSGVWVVFEEPDFCGEPYILEKGLYGSPEDWGALQHRVGSAMPVLLDDFENTAKFKVQLFSEPSFQGSVLDLEDSAPSLQDGFSVASCKVLAGSWQAFESQDFTGKMYVLEEGSYPDLRAMGCVSRSSSILSLQTVGFEFSLPSITLFERCGLRGKRVLLTDGSVNLQLAGGCGRVQSVLVEGGMWILYEGINYRGAQILLKPGEVPDWRRFSSWQKIGSLRPLIQKQVHFRLRNRQTGLIMSVTGDLDEIKLLRIQETEETDGLEQIWSYHNGQMHCKLLEECCLCPSGSVTIAGSRVGLTPELDNQIHLWSITSKGFIRYTPSADLVLDVKGGHNYDKNQVILNTLDPNKLHQRWDVEII
ncbi:beta/gamma crystallin domain-containing protein 1 isoform X2 [Kryptolebias marmoratus]|uniref:Beta/gamma crystallin domain-containing protein 1-like n=1 Tax=Kryptolebias marmoratus TaxID=37003 RepID=A0A3Q3BCV5_KRYMA|nr:beta/gamma crystallin domain-containing protein 1 isoform X2 [Kryptolebias marmoratus]